jgi:RNA recognition motif-containing protein
VVFNLDPGLDTDDLRTLFASYGEVKEIRETPNKRHHKFVEFFDIRDAEKAMRFLNKTEIMVRPRLWREVALGVLTA